MPVKFLKSANLVSQYFSDKRNQICIVGRSNVGKSSLINALANNSKIAKTSSTPGHTKLVNFFDFGDYVLVDLPGYGYSKTEQDTKNVINEMIVEYLNYGHNLICVLQLCNLDVITTEDKEMSVFLNKMPYKHLVVLTKADRTNKSHFDNNKQKIASYLEVDVNDLIPVSVKNNTNITKLKSILKAINLNAKKEKAHGE